MWGGNLDSFLLLSIIVLLLSYFLLMCLECEDEKNNTCKSNGKCVNVPGSFHCVCIEGYHLDTEACVADQPARKSSLAINLAIGDYNYYNALSSTSNVTFSCSVVNHTKNLYAIEFSLLL